MRTGSSKVHFVLFGQEAPATEVLHDAGVQAALTALAAGEQPAEVPDAAAAMDLIRRRDNRWEPGRRFLCLPPLTPVHSDALAAAARHSAERVVQAIPRLQDALASTLGGTSDALWHRYGLMVVAGLLLDLAVGQALRNAQWLPEADPGWCIWAVPTEPDSAPFGVRVVYDAALDLGAGTLWHAELPHSAALPREQDLQALAAVLAGERADPDRLLRLRYLGWVSGTRCDVPFFEADAPLWTTIEQLAGELVAGVYAPLEQDFDPLVPRGDSRRFLLSRLLMERTLGHLVRTELVPNPRSGGETRWIWRRRNWHLVSETSGG